MNQVDRSIIEKLINLKHAKADLERMALVFHKSENENVIIQLNELSIDIDKVGNDLVEINLEDLPFNVFANEKDFLKRVSRKSWNKSIFLLEEKVFYSVSEDKSYINFIENSEYLLISNNYYAFKFLKFLKTQDHKELSAFYFVDYFNWDSGHVVLTSLKKDGKVELLLPRGGINLKSDVNIKKAVSDFESAFDEQNKHLPKFIKIELISAISKIEKNKRLDELLVKLNEIIYTASQNFEIYIHDLSLENLKKDFIEYKNKYFIQLREVLSKLTNQVISLPLAIAASVFSTYKVTDSLSTLLIILTTFLIYILYSVYLLKLQKEDIVDMRTNFEIDYKRLAESQFFKKFENELEDFNKIKRKLIIRTRSLISALDLYFFFFASSAVLFVIYLLLQMGVTFFGITTVALLLSAGLLVIYILTQTLSRD